MYSMSKTDNICVSCQRVNPDGSFPNNDLDFVCDKCNDY